MQHSTRTQQHTSTQHAHVRSRTSQRTGTTTRGLDQPKASPSDVRLHAHVVRKRAPLRVWPPDSYCFFFAASSPRSSVVAAVSLCAADLAVRSPFCSAAAFSVAHCWSSSIFVVFVHFPSLSSSSSLCCISSSSACSSSSLFVILMCCCCPLPPCSPLPSVFSFTLFPFPLPFRRSRPPHAYPPPSWTTPVLPLQSLVARLPSSSSRLIVISCSSVPFARISRSGLRFRHRHPQTFFHLHRAFPLFSLRSASLFHATSGRVR